MPDLAGVKVVKIFCRHLDTMVSLTLNMVSYPSSSGAGSSLSDGIFAVSTPASPAWTGPAG
ncbi:hypothetical protein [Parafrankia elaeagni]|uniref:hypothetical protein n=1 Tax=Parafrankia elaeagni TaxID=222534 RepID=UPI0012B550B0|nr:hypothetical protein [Parafrankia elaeagni]